MKLLAVPNFSEGRDEEVISALAGAIGGAAAEVLDTHVDEIHNRTVFTILGNEEQLSEALVQAAEKAMELIDLTSYDGAHPHIGALDVCPVVYTEPSQREAAEEVADTLASEIAAIGIPVMFYGQLAASPDRTERAYFRKGGTPALRSRMSSGELEPDRGPAEPHPSAGVTLLAARPPLGAFNVELAGIDLLAGRKIARRVRESGGGREGVRAIAIDFGDGKIQISTNIHDPIGVPLGLVVEDIWECARPLGGTPISAELVGLIPVAALEGYPKDVPIVGFEREAHTIEARLAESAG